MLYSLEIPASGGNTSFCSMYAVYDALPGRLKERIAASEINTTGTYNSAATSARASTPTTTPHLARALHPLVCTHPDTAVACLSRRRRNASFGLALAESEAARRLWSYVEQPQFAWSMSGASAPRVVGQPLAPAPRDS